MTFVAWDIPLPETLIMAGLVGCALVGMGIALWGPIGGKR